MRGLTQERLSELSGVSRNQISNIERNISNTGNHVNPRLETIYQLARALEVPVAALLPASGDILKPILPAEKLLNVDVVWPAQSTDLVAFDHRHLTEELPQYNLQEYSGEVIEATTVDAQHQDSKPQGRFVGVPESAVDGGNGVGDEEGVVCENQERVADWQRGVGSGLDSDSSEQPEGSTVLSFCSSSEDAWLMGVQWPWTPRDSSQTPAR